MSWIDRIGDRLCVVLTILGLGYIFYWHMMP